MNAAAQDGWAPGPLRPSLPDGAVHVWRADLAAASSGLGKLLCSEEQARAQRILNQRDGELWRRSRGLLRALLGRYLQVEPEALRFSIGQHGKPLLLPGTEHSTMVQHEGALSPDRLRFNLSHSAQWALYAVSSTCAVGVDVEVARRPVDEVAIARRILGAAVVERLQALDPDARRREFLRAWVRHEAALKCVGVGIGGTDEPRHEPWVAEIELGLPDAAAAVAATQPAGELRRWAWRG
jgi:4'-phosphopantetheinyl transferase